MKIIENQRLEDIVKIRYFQNEREKQFKEYRIAKH